MQSFFAKFLIFNSQLIFIVSVSMYLCWTYWKKLNQEINDLEIPYQALGFFSVVFPDKEDASSLNRGSVDLADMGASLPAGDQSYHQRWSIRAVFIIDDPVLGPVLSSTQLPASEGWKDELA